MVFISHNADVQLTDGGPSGTPELLDGIPGPPFVGAPAGFLFFGSLAVNSKMLSRANHGADDANMPATIIAHTPAAITMLRRVILIADTSCSIAVSQHQLLISLRASCRKHALHSGSCRLLLNDWRLFIQFGREYAANLRKWLSVSETG